jgi:glutamyl-tRNA synthetase
MKKEKFSKKIEAYALKNAIEHEGKAQVNSILNSLFHEGLNKKDVKEIIPIIQEQVNKINSLSLEEQKNLFEKEQKQISHRDVREEGELPELENVKGKIVLRLAPYPSGALHIGNTKTYLLNALYAEKYHGKLLFVMDDTIGSEEKQIMLEAYTLIPEAFDWLNVKYEKPIIYKSDRLEIYYKYAEELIKKDKAYVCSCKPEILRENRAKGIECEHRKQTIKQNLELWKEMFSMKEGQAALRIKTSMQDKNPAFRDRVLFKISDREHPKVKNKYRVWPTLEMSWAIDDHILNISHIIRGKELMIETDMEKYIMDIFKWKHPEFIHVGWVKLEGVYKISKSKAQQEIKSGKFFGWHDPRTWSVQSLMMRGIEAEAIKKFVVNMGLKLSDALIPVDVLYSHNRELIREKSIKASFKRAGLMAKSNIEILMPDAKTIKGNSDINISSIKDKQIVYFLGFGYTRYNEKEKIKFWFAHA